MNPFALTSSILHTVLYLLEGDPTFSADSETVLEFKRALKLIAEIESEHGITEQSRRPSLDEVSQDTVQSHKRPQ